LVDGYLLPLFSSVVDALGWFGAIDRAVVSCLQTPLLQRDNVSPQTQHNISFKKPELTTMVGPTSPIRDWCASQDPIAVISRYVSLDTNGVGCCPFGWHHNEGCDTHPSFVVYRPISPDICCWYCHVWKQGGSLFDFLRFYYALEPRELWQQILAGGVF
ncbi:MAG TPA: hypothetical protein VHT52_16750, partial [Stellaceae bacterium]|nr:hypothetical protein [Stellaceae bacterium]